jgi:hypothetical protein
MSDNNQRHRLTVSGTLQAPWQVEHGFARIVDGLQLGYIFTYASRLPFNIVTGNDRNFDTNFNDRPVGIGRNTGRGFDFASFDVRLSKRFRFTERVSIDALAEGFNILNRSNLQLPNNTFGTGTTPLPSFGQATAASDPRQLQFGLRLNF